MTILNRRHALALITAAATLPQMAFSQDRTNIVDVSLGDANAPITVVEYASFTCPHCANFHKTVWPQLKANYIDTGKVHFVFREVYFDRVGVWAAMIARCAPQDRYFGIADHLFNRQREWTSGGSPEETVQNLFAIGRQAGLSDGQMTECMSDRAYAEALVAEYQKNSEADDITSTPAFIINGEKASNMNYEDFSALLDKELAG